MATAAAEAPLRGWQLLVTRPTILAAPLVARLTALGGTVTAAPLLRTVPVAPDLAAQAAIGDLDRFDTVIVTSRAAVAHGLPLLADRWPQWPAGQRWVAVGAGTAQALADWQLHAEFPPQEATSEGVLALLGDVRGARILLLTGVGGRGLLDSALAASGAQLVRLSCYRREADPAAGAALAHFAQCPPPRAALVTSSEALQNLPDDFPRDVLLVTASGRIAAEARAAGYAQVQDAGNADDERMTAALIDATRARREP